MPAKTLCHVCESNVDAQTLESPAPILRRRGIGMARARKVLAASVIPWQDEYGIAVVFERGNHIAYRVGDREEAERHVQLALDDQYDPTARILRTAVDIE
jgi:hypothetical protein